MTPFALERPIDRPGIAHTYELIAKHVPVIIGPDSTAAAAAIEPLVHNDLVLYCFTPSVHPAAGSYIFSSFISTKDLAVAGVRYLRTRGLTKIRAEASSTAVGRSLIATP